MTTINALTKAIDTIAEFMNEPMIKTDRDTGEQVEVNALAYAQRRLFNGICYSAALTLQSSTEQLDLATEKVRVAARAHRGDEISEQQLARAIDWADRMQIQVTTLNALLEVALEDAHLTYTQVSVSVVQPTSHKFARTSRAQRSSLPSASALT
jgi:hypothetical protein